VICKILLLLFNGTSFDLMESKLLEKVSTALLSNDLLLEF
jgi:hypothetical protein